MRYFSPVLLCLVLGIGIAACSSVEEKPENQKAASSRTGNAAPPVAENIAVPANSAAAPAVENEIVSADPVGKVKKNKMEEMRREARNSPPANIDLDAELKKSARPAAEDSEFGVVLTDVVFERRTFNSHPLLLKVEKITAGEKKTIKVYFKDGRIVEVAGEKINSISTVGSVGILKAAGIDVPAAVRKPGSKTSEQ